MKYSCFSASTDPDILPTVLYSRILFFMSTWYDPVLHNISLFYFINVFSISLLYRLIIPVPCWANGHFTLMTDIICCQPNKIFGSWQDPGMSCNPLWEYEELPEVRTCTFVCNDVWKVITQVCHHELTNDEEKEDRINMDTKSLPLYFHGIVCVYYVTAATSGDQEYVYYIFHYVSMELCVCVTAAAAVW